MLSMMTQKLERVEKFIVVDSSICCDLRLQMPKFAACRAKLGSNRQKIRGKDMLAGLQIAKVDVALIAFVPHLFGCAMPVSLSMQKLRQQTPQVSSLIRLLKIRVGLCFSEVEHFFNILVMSSNLFACLIY